ncbi:hypothetical protein ASZ90_017083 [hydrocarbon metagenome]|uniref:Response regulatory domain-containing protein n=1 Tax=hydrocarbon metagenome TaxID=938273 RepID=A0A0W8EAC6_9ZZZZ
MKPLKVLLCGDTLLYNQDLAAAFENISYEVLGEVPANDLMFEASILQPDIVVWQLDDRKKYSSSLKELRFCCPSSYLFILSDNPAHMDICTMFDLAITACLPTFLPAVQIANAVDLSIDAGLICLRDEAPSY